MTWWFALAATVLAFAVSIGAYRFGVNAERDSRTAGDFSEVLGAVAGAIAMLVSVAFAIIGAVGVVVVWWGR